MFLQLFITVLVLHIYTKDVIGMTFENTLSQYDALFTSHNKILRPIINQSLPVYVNVEMFLASIDGFDEVSGILSILAIFIETWKDEILTWDPSIGVTNLVLPQDDIWRPNLFNVKVASKFLPISDSSFTVRVFFDGSVIWMPGGTMKVKCSPDVTKFPFDVQKCTIQVLSWGYSKTEVVLVSTKSTVDQTYYEPNGEWDILSTSVRQESDDAVSLINIDLEIKRLPLFHILNTLLPVVLLGIVTPMVFLLPCESGERSGYSLTMLLSSTVFLTVVNDALPSTSDPMSTLSYFVCGMMVYSVVITAVNVVQLNLFFRSETEHVPFCVQRFIRVVNCASCSGKRKIEPIVKVENLNGESVNNGDGEIVIMTNVTMTWQDVVRVLDKVYVFFFFTIIIGFSLLFFVLTAKNA